MRPYPFYRFFAVGLIIFAFSSAAFTQGPPITWGDIPRADLEMKYFPQDTNASAVILCDIGESSFNNDLNIVFKRHLRVKILTTKGYEWGTRVVSLYSKDDIEQISNIEGTTFSLDEKGGVLTNTLNEKDIFKEEVNETYTRYRFTMPALKPGCVIEIRYNIESKRFWFMRDWFFQHEEPVRWSEYSVTFPHNILYAGVKSGYEPYFINETKEINNIFEGSAGYYLGSRFAKCTNIHLAVKDIPAIREEPYITTLDDYRNKLEIQLSAYALVGTEVHQVMNSWNKFTEDLVDEENFCGRIDDTRKVQKTAAQITAHCATPEEKMKAIYDWVSKSIVWTGQDHVFADLEPDEVLESKKGSNADITFLILSLLKSVGIHGEPVLLSTRSNGKIQKLYPILSQFNYVLARVVIESQPYYLDATDPLRPQELLPIKVLNTQGLIIRKDASEWTLLTTNKKYINNSLASVHVNEDGSLSGIFEDSYKEYAGLVNRHDLQDKKDIDVAKESFQTEQLGFTIDSVVVADKDSIHSRLKLTAWVTSPSYAQRNGDLMYINPHILHRKNENPFKSSTRQFPIDYSYQRSHTNVVTMTIPPGFEVKESLVNQFFAVSDFATYSREIHVDSNQVQIMSKLDIRATEIPAKLYKRLKEFYSQMVSAESEQVVLARIKKQDTPAPGSKTSKKKGKK